MSDHLTHRIEGLADHPAARAQLPTGRIPARPRTCQARADRSGSTGVCGGHLNDDGECQRKGTHR